MISLVERALKKLGIVSPFDKDEVLNAEIEDTAREYEGVIERLHQSFYRRLQANERLRKSIKVAKHRTNSFAEFELLTIRREEGQHND